jgi:hypothetical protein
MIPVANEDNLDDQQVPGVYLFQENCQKVCKWMIPPNGGAADIVTPGFIPVM